MSAVIRGIGIVCWPAWRCQSLSASTRLPRSARRRNTPWPDGQAFTSPSPSGRVSISVPQTGHASGSILDANAVAVRAGDPRRVTYCVACAQGLLHAGDAG